ncbi:hypothetical protein ES332_A06G091600v1 [Gossypium tomentosum]|uniref:Uncharacterized protein n=1 Tax=Gossypium tomentosum TaxID=34277 RepID=A0A5D2Q1I7_GOSTO|nr:hypothetical protein ES332_A06G091600v1 [Gossypium tomentosum]
MDSATVHEEIDSFFESTSPLEDSAKIIDKLNQFIQFDYPSGEGKGRKVEELLKRCPNLKKIIIFRVISKAKPHKECQVAWETEFPLIAIAKALQIFKKRSQCLHVIQVYLVYWYSCFVFSSF